MNIKEIIEARPLTQFDADAFKKLRLRSLKEDGSMFCSTLEEEENLSKEEWIKRVTPTDKFCCFGLFCGKELIGFMRATPWEEDKTGETVLWGYAYVAPQFRGQGLGKPLYELRAKWTLQHPEYKKAVMSIRCGNERSKEIHMKHGAEYMYTHELRRPNGEETLWNWYKIDLKESASLLSSPPRPQNIRGLKNTRTNNSDIA